MRILATKIKVVNKRRLYWHAERGSAYRGLTVHQWLKDAKHIVAPASIGWNI
jgi:hypothetical protein